MAGSPNWFNGLTISFNYLWSVTLVPRPRQIFYDTLILQEHIPKTPKKPISPKVALLSLLLQHQIRNKIDCCYSRVRIFAFSFQPVRVHSGESNRTKKATERARFRMNNNINTTPRNAQNIFIAAAIMFISFSFIISSNIAKIP